MTFFGEKSLRRAVNAYLIHYHGERNHQRLGNNLIDPGEEADYAESGIHCREQPGGLLKYYDRNAA